MRTGIYVYATSTLTFTASETLVMTAYPHQDQTINATTWTCSAVPGIYKVVSNASVTVASSGGDVAVIAEPNDKNPFPEPPPRALSTFSVTSAQVESFFVIPNMKSIAL